MALCVPSRDTVDVEGRRDEPEAHPYSWLSAPGQSDMLWRNRTTAALGRRSSRRCSFASAQLRRCNRRGTRQRRLPLFELRHRLRRSARSPGGAGGRARYRQVAAEADDQQLFVAPQLVTYSLLFNSKSSPFDDARLRRAVNFALDRRALASKPYPDATGIPTDLHIPPGKAWYRDTAIYPLGGPYLERARQLAGGSKKESSSTPATCRPARNSLRSSGRTSLRLYSASISVNSHSPLSSTGRASRRAVRPR